MDKNKTMIIQLDSEDFWDLYEGKSAKLTFKGEAFDTICTIIDELVLNKRVAFCGFIGGCKYTVICTGHWILKVKMGCTAGESKVLEIEYEVDTVKEMDGEKKDKGKKQKNTGSEWTE